MPSEVLEQDSFRKDTGPIESLTLQVLTERLVALELKVTDMEETLASLSEDSTYPEMTQMSFRRNRRALAIRPVSSLKHVVDTSGAVTAGIAATTDLVIQHDDPATTFNNRVHTGAHVKAIFLSVQVVGTTAYSGVPKVYFLVYKDPSGQIPSPPVVDSVGVSAKRKFVIHQEMLMVTTQSTTNDGFPRTMFKGVILIPRRYSRFGDGDRLRFTIGNAPAEATGSTDWCLQCIYKEFF